MITDVSGEMDYLGPPPSPSTALATLAEPLRSWFLTSYGEPTPAQRLAWPAIAAGQTLLLCAPTGSGKTLAAFLPVIGRLLGEEPRRAGAVRCLYVAPLKALGNDVRRNLRHALRGMRAFDPASADLRVGLRSGDTPARVRRRQERRPPHLLLTTPESLALLLSRPSATAFFRHLRWVVIDEIHSLAGSKRGADLALSLERLDAMAGDRLQRIGLSATCAPLTAAAGFLAGTGRPCAIAHVADPAPLRLDIEPLEEEGAAGPGPRPGFVHRLVDRLLAELARHRTVLIFTNVRSLAERLVWALRQRLPDLADRVAVHHSALAPERRRAVERRLKKGDLRAVVSSTSLELGIDVGSVDLVVLVHPPGGVVRLLQRVGRAGHGPGRTRRGLVLTSTAAELLEAAVTGGSGHSAQYEPLAGPAHPLDVLCQQLLGMAAARAWTPDEACTLARQAFPYRELPRTDFDRCLDYLSGRRSDGRPWLPARLRWVGETFAIADARTARIVRRNLGTILAEEPRPVRLQGAAADAPAPHPAVGEVEEAFADRLRPGDRFLLDGRCLEYRRTEGPAVLVEEVLGRPVVPRWSGEGWPLARDLARRLYLLRVRAAEALREGPSALAGLLRADYGLAGAAVPVLVAHFQGQECASEIPDAATLLAEAVPDEGGVAYYLHTPLNRAGNDALARVAALRLGRARGWAVTSLVADLGFALFVRRPVALTPEDWRTLLTADGFDDDLAAALAASETLRERFRRVALTGLMLLRNPLGAARRVGGADWAERRLFDKVRADDPDFVLLRQALREVQDECCDAPAARAFLLELPRRTVRCRRLAAVSPFAAGWTQAGPGPAEVVETPEQALERLLAELGQTG